MSGQVASHTKDFSEDQGVMMTPFGFFPSHRNRRGALKGQERYRQQAEHQANDRQVIRNYL